MERVVLDKTNISSIRFKSVKNTILAFLLVLSYTISSGFVNNEGYFPQDPIVLRTKTNDPEERFIKLFMEINQSYDWNDYYTLDILPQEHNYKDNNQPAIVYTVLIDLKKKNQTYKMRPIGHSHISGKDGLVYRDMENITTALSIVREVKIKVK